MFFNDLFSVFQWWLMVFVISLIFLPITIRLFSSFFDKGYAFSKILGILLVSYFIWLIASLKIFPFTNFLIIASIAVFLIINLVILIKKNILSEIFQHKKIFIVEELIFLGCFLFWSVIKSYEPSIHGLEKFMDFGFINSILRSEYFPPKDMWLAPYTINYYYFGHYVCTLLIKLSNVAPEIGYNLTLASIFGLCFTASFSIGANLLHFFTSSKLYPKPQTLYPILSGFLSAFLVTLGGNLQTVYIFFQKYATENPTPFWLLPMMLNPEGYWYPNATRFIPFTIHEFPLYSFVVSDLHGHVFDIPFVLLLIALLINIFYSNILNTKYQILISLLIAIFLMTNVLDGPIYLLIIFCVLLAKKLASHEIPLITPIFQASFITLGSIILSLPFWLNFKPFGSGIGVICSSQFLINLGHLGPFLFEANHCTRTPFWMLLILWGFPLFILIVFIIHLLPSTFKNLSSVFHHLSPTDKLALVLSFAAIILIFIPEFFYVKDIYPAHWRANTVFKFSYQAFIILGLTSGYMLTRMISKLKTQISNLFLSYLLFTFIFLLFILVAIYPSFAINSYFGGLKNYHGLNGQDWLKDSYPTDYQAILWIKKNIPGQPVILEAQGDSYTDYARISANTGLPTVIGWPVHEWLWRGSYDEAGKRSGEVTELYESKDLELTKQLLQKYQVKYVFIGSLEKQKYTKLDEEKFNTLGKIIYQNGNTKIYQLNSL